MSQIALTSGPVRLGQEIARGGEGAIFDLPEQPERVVKIYHTALTPERADKLQAMATHGSPAIEAMAAWPLDTVRADGAIVGLVMQRVRNRHDFDALLSGSARRRFFPNADYRMLIAVAANLARAVAAVHTAGHVIGDINERCAMVGADGTVRLIDCDSFQIEADGVVYPCDVGTPMYQPPELQDGKPFRGRRRTRNHDSFGLAVLIFRLLFFGRHPFAGRPAVGEAPELPEAIRAHLFAWSGRISLRQPPNTLNLGDVGPQVEEFFRRAFGPEGAEAGRPRASAWAEALGALQDSVRQCDIKPAHWHIGPHCPICAIEAANSVSMFVDPDGVADRRPETDAGPLWAAIRAVPRPVVRSAEPTPRSLRSSITARPYPARPPATWLQRVLGRIGLGGPDRAEFARRHQALNKARQRYEQAVQSWRTHDPGVPFEEAQQRLEVTFEAIGKRVRQRDAAVEAARSRMALMQYLSGFAVVEAGIRGFGRSLIATLDAHGMSSAADLTQAGLAVVPGIGPKRRTTLMEWRDTIAAEFRPDTIPLLPRTALRAIDSKFDTDIAALLDALRVGTEGLWTLREAEDARTRAAWKAVTAAAQAVAQAEADLDAPVVAQ